MDRLSIDRNKLLFWIAFRYATCNMLTTMFGEDDVHEDLVFATIQFATTGSEVKSIAKAGIKEEKCMTPVANL